MPLDPGVELLPDAPVVGPGDDLLGHGAVAERLVELACAAPLVMPRVVAVVGASGAGKTGILNLVGARLGERGDAAAVAVDAGEHPSAESLVGALQRHLGEFFEAAGVVETSDAARDALARYGEVVSTVVKLVGVKLDVAGAVKRSETSLAQELAENAQQLGKRLVITIDHLDRMADRDLGTTLIALRMYAQLPYTSLVLAYDRRALATRAGLDRGALARLVTVELAVPPCDRALLARLVAGGLARAATRLGADLDPVLPLFDPDGGGVALALLETPRDGKRAVNALTAALPLVTGEPRRAALDLVVRLIAPELDGPRLEPVAAELRRARAAELREVVAHHPRAAALAAAIDELLG